MTKYHINSKGVPAVCRADRGNCPFGGPDSHFNTQEEAQKKVDQENQEKHGILPELSKFTPLSEKYNISEEWVKKFLEHNNFEEFARVNGSSIVKSGIFDSKEDIYEKTLSLWKDLHYENSLNQLSKLDDYEAVQVVQDNLSSSTLNGWFREYNSEYKPRIENALITNPELRNASLNIAHRVYQESTGELVNFDDFIEMEIEVYRGGNFKFIDSDVFVSYSFDKKIAEKFCTKENPEILTRKIKIKDTLGSLQTTGEAEIMIPRYI